MKWIFDFDGIEVLGNLGLLGRAIRLKKANFPAQLE